MRLFVAASVPDEIRTKLAVMKKRLEPLPVRWVRPEGIHLTLKFLGEIPEERVERIEGALRRMAGCSPQEVEVRGIGAFPDRGRPRVIWAGLSACPGIARGPTRDADRDRGGDVAEVARLVSSIETALEQAGFPRETREFRAHLTLGRFREPPRGEWRSALNRHADEEFGTFRIEEFALYESVLQPGGARYRVVSRFMIDGEKDV
ncbi:MAG: RNA 2',3'-cyclic phosphodiesterase [Acidobacteria bacterium]|nr:RNA 2',3'-cyclic phosphodiesterase [Acidobacteriota bacterium]